MCGETLPAPSTEDGRQTTPWTRPGPVAGTRAAAVEALFDDTAARPDVEFEPEPLPDPAAESAAPQASPPPGDVAVWISCPPLAAVPLLKGTTELYVGRTKTHSQVVLPHHAVSRRHAVFRVTDGEIRVEDLSSNGSFLNGKRIQNSVVRIGDVLTIGPYDLDILAEPPNEDSGDGAHTSEFDFASITSGLIEGNALPEMIQSLEFNGKTGTLKILAGQLRGLLVVRDGRPQYASFGDTHDEEAVLGMLDLSYGRYTFFMSPEAGPCTIKRSLTALLLDHSRKTDEG